MIIKKINKRFVLWGLMFLLICFVINYKHYLEASDDKLQLNQRHLTVALRDSGAYIESIIINDPYSVYNYLTSISLNKADYEIMERWDYKIILTNDLTFEEKDLFYISKNKHNSVIYIYNTCIEIDGVLYEFPNDINILEWFNYFFEENKVKYKCYILCD